MAAVFFDTSALVRRYHRPEPGADRVRALCHGANRNTLLILRVTPVEVASALNRLLREGAVDQPTLRRLWRLFRGHCRSQYPLLDVDEPTHALAEQLLFAHRLRAYDAIQLAGALRTATMLRQLSANFRFCTADRAQAGVAVHEGLQAEVIG